jgi:hypothetical protein
MSARRATCALLLILSAGCGTAVPSSPTSINQPAPTPAPAPPSSAFPPLSGPFRTFSFARELSFPVAEYTKQSRFDLYDNGALVLQYRGLTEYRGRYTDTRGVLAFEWGTTWMASGSLQEDRLTVQYNLQMKLDDFEDAVYARTD